MLEQHDEAMGQRRNVAGATRSRQTNHSSRCLNQSGIQIPKAINFSRAQKSEMDTTGLQQAHHTEHVKTLGRVENIRRISHGVDQFSSRGRADDAVFEETDSLRRMSLLRDNKCYQRQSHADEN